MNTSQNEKSAVTAGWIVLDTKTGAMDGTYYDRDAAMASLSRMKQRYPGGWWFLATLEGEGHPGPSEEMFWRKRLASPQA